MTPAEALALALGSIRAGQQILELIAENSEQQTLSPERIAAIQQAKRTAEERWEAALQRLRDRAPQPATDPLD